MILQPGSALQRRSGFVPPQLSQGSQKLRRSFQTSDQLTARQQRRSLLVRSSILEAQNLNKVGERFTKGFPFQKSGSARYLEVDIVLQNPDKALEFNRGSFYLIDEEGRKSKPEKFYKVTSALNLGGKLGKVSKLLGSNNEAETIQASVLQLDHEVPKDFGKTAAVMVRAEAFREDVRFWLLKVTVREGENEENEVALAESWVHCKQEWRVFWMNKFYLPADMPPALQTLREQELEGLRDDNKEERRPWDRIYNYAVYNDLGTPEKPRPTLKPYPSREATNRPLNDDGSEGPSGFAHKASWMPELPLPPIPGLKKQPPAFFIPFDEEFSPSKAITFKKNGLLYLIPLLVDKVLENVRTGEKIDGFDSILDIHRFFSSDFWNRLTGWLPDNMKILAPNPAVVNGRVTEWETDEEVGRQTLAGQNPCMLRALRGIPEGSIITAEQLQPWVEQNDLQGLFASGNRLFEVDYTALKGFLASANTQMEKGERLFYMYATRGIFYLTNNGYMTLIAIEMIDCPDPKKPEQLAYKVVLPRGSGPDNMDKQYWRLAKAYFASNDSGYHQLVSHWLRTHACTEPYIIATRRQLSTVHPIYGLLHPHFKYTMPINRNARQRLINAGGVIESCFSPSAYCLRISSAIYGLDWRFDKEALPADLIHRGMAIEDPNGNIAWKGKKYASVLADYPYAEDGMLIWDTLHTWCSDYLKVYYADDQAVESDTELNAWWKEIQEKGHPDINEGWPALKTISDLVDILTTIMWICSGHHAAVNFGQYTYSAFMPNHPSATHQPMPDPYNEEVWRDFKENPDGTFLDTVSSRAIAMKIFLIVELLSTHDPAEEYLGERTDGWTSDPRVLEVFAKYKQAVSNVDKTVDERNKNFKLKSRFPDYTTLQPHTSPEDVANIKARGVPNSISI